MLASMGLASVEELFDAVPAALRLAGAYDHDIPSVVNRLAFRSEFVTAYTPYQPEVAQGVLQALFEYQNLVCRLFGTDVANASLYDGASACVEAVNLAGGSTRRFEVWVFPGGPP